MTIFVDESDLKYWMKIIFVSLRTHVDDGEKFLVIHNEMSEHACQVIIMYQRALI